MAGFFIEFEGFPVAVKLEYPDGSEVVIGMVDVKSPETALADIGDGLCTMGEFVRTGKKQPDTTYISDLERMTADPTLN